MTFGQIQREVIDKIQSPNTQKSQKSIKSRQSENSKNSVASKETQKSRTSQNTENSQKSRTSQKTENSEKSLKNSQASRSSNEQQAIDLTIATGPIMIYGTSATLQFTNLNEEYPLTNLETPTETQNEQIGKKSQGPVKVFGTSATLQYTTLNENYPLSNFKNDEAVKDEIAPIQTGIIFRKI